MALQLMFPLESDDALQAIMSIDLTLQKDPGTLSSCHVWTVE